MMQENNPSYPFIATLLKKYSGGVIVDNGCGRNEFKRVYNSSVLGLEISENACADLIADGKRLPFKNRSINLFLSNFVLEHVEDQELYLQEMKRCLNTDGAVILSIPRPGWYFAYFLSPSVWVLPFKEFIKFIKSPLRFFTHGHPHKHSLLYELFEWREKNYLSLFKKNGFEVKEKHYTCNFLSLNVRYAKIFGSIKFPDFFNVHTTFVLKNN